MSAVGSAGQSAEWQQKRDALVAAIWRAHETRTPLIMGIVNVTPDSFSDGGCHDDEAAGTAHARRLSAEGASLLDIGGESTRPGADFVPASEEIARTRPVVLALADEPAFLSIDTYKASVAREAVRAGAVAINDVWGMQRDPAMARVMAETGAVAVLMHNREDIDPALDMRDTLRRYFDALVLQAERAGIRRERIVLDPGIGFGKTDPQNLESIRQIQMLREVYGLPVLLGLSRKSLFGRLLGRSVEARLAGTMAANLCGLNQGAAILRVHDVAPHVDAVTIATLLNRSSLDARA
ncbi:MULTISPECIES: dihydropteroate synthase [unclassified Asaia]|uniref:dihydropteroate synthase n=1 Tax=unclassified Asaia TaxID=2685023 RepID=UPI000F8F20A8|nr:dihydropteroate synthase [Asaia sp. W19]